jgi:hypothetical protein
MDEQTRVEFGRFYRYTGEKPSWMKDAKVQLQAMAIVDAEDDTEGAHITDATILAKFGGPGPQDHAFVQTWLPTHNRVSIMTDQVEWGNLAWLPDDEQPDTNGKPIEPQADPLPESGAAFSFARERRRI